MSDSAFLQAALQSLKGRASEAAQRYPSTCHMLVLPEGEDIRIPGRPGVRALGTRRQPPPRNVKFGRSAIATPLPPRKFWPADLLPVCAMVPCRDDPYRVHLFFGDGAGIRCLMGLANDVLGLNKTLRHALRLDHDMPSVFHRGYVVADAHISERVKNLDAWLSTIHWWAWKAVELSIYTKPLAAIGDQAFEVDRTSDAMRDRLSFSRLTCDIFTASAVTLDLFGWFFDDPPDMRWPVDYPTPRSDQMPEEDKDDGEEPPAEVDDGTPAAPVANTVETGQLPEAAKNNNGEEPSADGGDHQTVTLMQAAAIVNKSKRTLERYQEKDSDFPLPVVEGGGGMASEWLWVEMRTYLEKKCRRKNLPEKYPSKY